jgi:3-hydroxyacyl-CoA dehydrogenase
MAQYFLKNRVSFIRFSNLPVNGLSLAVRDGIMRGLDTAKKDKVDGLVLFGEGKNFSAGADISEFAKGKHLLSPSLNEVLEALDDFDKPLLACINGVALGGGLETALSCQWRLSSPKALIGLPEVHLGILPGE